MNLGAARSSELELAVNKCRVEDQLRLGIGDLGLPPRFDLPLHRLKVPLDAIHSNRRCIDQVEALGMFGRGRREHSWNNVVKLDARSVADVDTGSQN